MDELAFSVHNLAPTFFTMWLGANDVLGYATAGGQGNGGGAALPVPGTNFYNTNDISPACSFQKIYAMIQGVEYGDPHQCQRRAY